VFQSRLLGVIVVCGVLAVLPTESAAQSIGASTCADCHFANPGSMSDRHLVDFDLSPHSRQRVGCEKCHGGNPSTFERGMAHRGMISPDSQRSPVARTNVPSTCGTCHVGPFVAFQDSRHYQLLRAGNRNVPTCVTCHGSVAANVPSPKAVEGLCARCHADRKVAPRPELARNAGLAIAGLNEIRALLDQADQTIARIRDAGRKQQLQAQAQQARVPLIQAADAGHRFVYDMLEERLTLARTRAGALLEELANPPAR